MAVSTDLEKRLSLLRIDDDTKHNLRALVPVFQHDLDTIIRHFYDHIRSFPEGRKLLQDDDQIKALQVKQRKHWMNLFSCRFDDVYVQSAVRVGKIHFQHGVAPYIYIAGYNFFHCELIQALAMHQPNSIELANICTSVARVISLDMDIALSVYTREYWRKMAIKEQPHWVIE